LEKWRCNAVFQGHKKKPLNLGQFFYVQVENSI